MKRAALVLWAVGLLGCPAGPGSSDGGCPEGQARCGAACVDTQTDEANCGACGSACGVGETCITGLCSGTVDTQSLGDLFDRVQAIWLQSSDRTDPESLVHAFGVSLLPARTADDA